MPEFGPDETVRRFMPSSAGTSSSANEVPTAALPITEVTAWHGKPVPDREWVVHNRIMRRTVCSLSGEGAIGKGILSGQLCVGSVLGTHWVGAVLLEGPAIYIDAEDDEDELRRRFLAISAYYQTDFERLAGLHIISLVGRDAALGVADRNGIVRATPLFEQLLTAVERIKPVIIAVNSAADVFAVNENDRGQARQSVGLLRMLAIAGNSGVLLSTHPSRAGMSQEDGQSGSTAWNNSVRSRLYFKSAGDAADSDLRTLEMKKSNYGPRGEVLRLRWEAGVFKPVASPTTIEQAAKDAAVDSVFLRLLGRFNDNKQDVSPKRSNTYAPARFAEHQDANGIKSEDFTKAMQRLIDTKRIEIVEDGPRSRRRQRLRLSELRLVT